MAEFMTNLFNAIFEAGPTPTLMLATNVSLGALQVLFFALLVGTYSIHFVFLSLICAGLWASINWFASELRAAQEKEVEANRIRRRASGGNTGTQAEDSDQGEMTEVEDEHSKSHSQDEYVEAGNQQRASQTQSDVLHGSHVDQLRARHSRSATNEGDGDLSSASTSTDGEWERVESTKL